LVGYAQGLFDARLLGDVVNHPECTEALAVTQPQGAFGGFSQFAEAICGLGDGAAYGCKHMWWQMSEDSQGFGFDL